MGDADTEPGDSGEPASLDRNVERAFTCSLCGFVMRYEVPLLQAEAQSVCYNCGEWTTQTADLDVIVDAAREAATEFADGLLTERQALAYLLREVAGVDRHAAAEVMDSTPSNVDNLQRRAVEKVDAARELVNGLDRLRSPPESDESAESGNA